MLIRLSPSPITEFWQFPFPQKMTEAEELYKRLLFLLEKRQAVIIAKAFQKLQETPDGNELISKFDAYIKNNRVYEPEQEIILNIINSPSQYIPEGAATQADKIEALQAENEELKGIIAGLRMKFEPKFDKFLDESSAMVSTMLKKDLVVKFDKFLEKSSLLVKGALKEEFHSRFEEFLSLTVAPENYLPTELPSKKKIIRWTQYNKEKLPEGCLPEHFELKSKEQRNAIEFFETFPIYKGYTWRDYQKADLLTTTIIEKYDGGLFSRLVAELRKDELTLKMFLKSWHKLKREKKI